MHRPKCVGDGAQVTLRDRWISRDILLHNHPVGMPTAVTGGDENRHPNTFGFQVLEQIELPLQRRGRSRCLPSHDVPAL